MCILWLTEVVISAPASIMLGQALSGIVVTYNAQIKGRIPDKPE